MANAMICQPTLWAWVLTVAQLVPTGCFVVLIVNLVRQARLLRRPDGQTVSERLSTLGITWGWLALMVTIVMMWTGLQEAWSLGETSSDGALDQGILFISYAHSFGIGFVGLLLWAGAFCEASLFKYLWMRKMTTGHNQPSQSIAGKPGSD